MPGIGYLFVVRCLEDFCLHIIVKFHELMLFSPLLQANMWLGTLLMDRSDDIYRMKGLLSVEGMNERFVFQVTVKHMVGFYFSYMFRERLVQSV